jgi:hypothetical protein
MKTPVALIIFNRPDCTAEVLRAVARAKPEKLFVIADGPRPSHPEDIETCAAARAAAEQIDWECEVIRDFSDVNLGCKMRPVTGIDRVFEMAEEAIILEDDCLPDPSFFPFCEELLTRYRDDERVMMIGGVNFLGQWRRPIDAGGQSYYFSRFGGTWGWATWRRAWRLFDHEMKLWPAVVENRILEQIFPDPRHVAFWKEIFTRIYEGRLTDAWDYQWLLACWIHSGYRIFPEVNLISNIGFREDATHTFGESPLSAMPTAPIEFPLQHPRMMVRSVEADELIQQIFCPPEPAAAPNGLASRISGSVRRLSARMRFA